MKINLLQRFHHPKCPPCQLLQVSPLFGSPAKVGGYAKSLVNLYKKNFKSVTPLSCALNALILALKLSGKSICGTIDEVVEYFIVMFVYCSGYCVERDETTVVDLVSTLNFY